MQLGSPVLAFGRDGRTLVSVDGDAVTIDTARIAVEHPIAAVAFADQVWIAHGREPVCTRHAPDGRVLDTRPLPAGGATLVAAAVGAPAAAWLGAPTGPLALIAEPAALVALPGPRSAELALPLTGRRWVTATGARVVAPSGLACELAAGSRVLGGAIVLDGSAVVVLVERARGRELVVIGLSNGRPQLRHAIAPGPLRVAARRGLAALLVDARRIGVIDLRSGRVLGEVASDRDVADFALDPDGQRIALRDPAMTVEVLALREAFQRPAPITLPEPEPEPEPAATAPAPIEPPPPPPSLPRTRTETVERPIELRALAPRTQTSELSRTTAIELLDLETRRVALWALHAIAAAWDTRRIGYGNEGSHPYEHEVAALLGMNQGFAREHLAAAADHVAEHEARLAQVPDRRAAATPLGALAAELGLSPLAVDILLVVATPALWSEAARLYGILANDPDRALVDEALVEQIIGPRASRHELAAELDPRAPLVRLGAIAIDHARARPFAALEVDPIILARLRCEAPDLGPGLATRGSDRALEELALADHVVPAALAALARAPVPARIAVRGRHGAGRRTLIAALAAEAGRALGVVELALLPRGERDLAAALRGGLRRAQLAGLLPCVVGLEDVAFGEREHREQLVDVLRAHPGPLVVVLPATEAAPLDAGHVAIDLPVLAEGERLAVWRAALADAGLAVAEPAVLGARYRIGPGVIHRAVAAAVERNHAPDATAELERYLRQTRDKNLGAHARRIERLATWDQLVLPSDVTDSLRELVARVRHRRTVLEGWGMERTLATSRGLTALFSGPPGTGKTLVAGVIARELGLDLYQVDLSKLMSKWLGETERNLAAVFDAAEDGQVILLFDEADSLFAKRTEVRSSNDRYANLEVNYLLQRLDAFEGIAILTTNASGSIDPAFKRRLSFRLSFPFPDEDTREQLWRAHLPPTLPIAGELALDKLARKYQLSGGYIRNACLRAAFLAAEDGAGVTQQHLERAVALEYAELGKLSNSGAIE
jgi:ATPase family protein associated with various cellular activities (AAA)